MHADHKVSPKSWLAFDLNVLRRLKFQTAAIPFNPDPSLGAYLKRWGVRVAANDPLQSSWIRSVAMITNNNEKLSADDVNAVLEDAYVPGYRLANPGLLNWFSETDAWWFDNVRRRIDLLDTPNGRAIASTIAMAAGQYVMSFTDETREYRQPLSTVFRRLWSIHPAPIDNGANNTSRNKRPDDFLIDGLADETHSDLLFLRLPAAHGQNTRTFLGRNAWREEWLRSGSDFWDDLDASMAGRLGAATETKSQYLRLVDEILRKSSNIRNWAIAHVETGVISTQDLVETIGKIRRVDTVYTKDFSELTGAKAVIITA